MAIDAGTIISYFDVDISGLTHGLQMATEQMSGFAQGGLGGALESIGAAMTTAGRTLSLSLTTPLLGLGIAATRTGMEFDAQMSRVGAISGATGQDLQRLRDAAIQMGAESVFGATDAANALEYMGMAGWKTDQMIAGLPGIMNLAAASGEELATVSDIVTDALTAFGLQASDSAHFADVLAAASTNSNTNVGMMGETFKYVAPLAGTLGFTVEDTAAAIGLMANAGIKGGQAGTSLRAALTSLANPTKDAQAAMDTLGISMTHTDGSMKTLDEIMGDLRRSFSGLTEAEQAQYAAQIFGQEAMSGMLAIVNASEEDYKKLTDAINGSAGATQQMASAMLDNLSGDIEGLMGALESASLSLSDFLTPIVRQVVQFATGVVDGFNELAEPVKTAVFQFGAVGAAIGPVMLAGGKLIAVLSRLCNPLTLVAGGLALAYDHSSVLQGMVATLADGFSAFFTTLESGGGVLNALKTGMTTVIGEEAVSSIGSFLDQIQSGVGVIGEALGSITSGIGAFIGGLIDGDGLVGAWNSATQALSSFDWAGLGQSILTGVTGAFDAAGAWLSGLFSTALQAVGAINWHDLGNTIRNGVLSVFDAAGAWLSNLFGLGKTAAEGIDWSGIGSAIWTGITSVLDSAGAFLSGLFGLGKTAVEGMDWGTVGSTILGGVTSILDTAGAFLSKLFGLGKTAVEGMDWGTVGSAILGGVTSILDTAGAFLSNLFGLGKTSVEGMDWGTVGSAILGGVTSILDTAGAFLSNLFGLGKTAVEGMDWGTVGTAIEGGVTGVIDTAGTFLSGAFTAAKTAIDTIDWSTVGTAIGNGVTGVIDTAGTFLSGAFTAAKTAIDTIDWSTVGTAIGNGVNGVIDTAGTFLSGAFTAAKTAIDTIDWSTVGTAIGNGVTGVIDTAGTFLSGAFTAAKTTIEGIQWGDVGSAISTGLSGALDVLGKIGGGIWDTITGWFSGDDEDSAQKDAEAMMEGLSTGITTGAGPAVTAATTAATGVTDAMATALSLEGGTTIATTWMTGLSTGITTGQTTLVTDAQTAAEAATAAADTELSSTNGTTTTTTWMTGLSTGITTGQVTLTTNAQMAASSAASAAATEMSYTTGSGIGLNMMLGMAAGVRTGAASVSSAIRSAARSAVSAARSALRINSPSGVFADEVGAWIPAGIGEGVSKNLQSAIGPMQDMRSRMLGVMSGMSFQGGQLNPYQEALAIAGGSPVTLNVNITGDWTVRSEEDKRDITERVMIELTERLRQAMR